MTRQCALQLLWRYNKEAVALRIAFFTSARPGGVAHTVLVRDIPGLGYGTLPNRLEDTALRFLPRFIKRRLVVGGACALGWPLSNRPAPLLWAGLLLRCLAPLLWAACFCIVWQEDSFVIGACFAKLPLVKGARCRIRGRSASLLQFLPGLHNSIYQSSRE